MTPFLSPWLLQADKTWINRGCTETCTCVAGTIQCRPFQCPSETYCKDTEDGNSNCTKIGREPWGKGECVLVAGELRGRIRWSSGGRVRKYHSEEGWGNLRLRWVCSQWLVPHQRGLSTRLFFLLLIACISMCLWVGMSTWVQCAWQPETWIECRGGRTDERTKRESILVSIRSQG